MTEETTPAEATPAEPTVESLQAELESYKANIGTYEDAFNGYDADSKESMLNLAQLLVVDPEAGAKALREVADAISPAELNEVVKEVEKATKKVEEAPPVVTKAELESILAERDSQAQLDVLQQEIVKEATELGYPPNSTDHLLLLLTAQNETKSGDLKEAAKILEARNEEKLNALLEKKKAQGASNVKPTTGSSPVGQDGSKAKTFTDARARLEARLKAVGSGGDS